MGTVEAILQRRSTLQQADLDEQVRQSARDQDDDATLILIQLGQDLSLAASDRQLERYAALAATERQALLADLVAHHHTPAAALRTCYHLETAEALRCQLYALLVHQLSKAERIALADAAARCHQRKLLEQIIDSLKRA